MIFWEFPRRFPSLSCWKGVSTRTKTRCSSRNDLGCSLVSFRSEFEKSNGNFDDSGLNRVVRVILTGGRP